MINEMTTPTIINSCDVLARENSSHVRITHSVSKGFLDSAADLLFERMKNCILDYLEGDIEDPELIAAAELINSLPGIYSTLEMRLAARREINRLHSL